MSYLESHHTHKVNRSTFSGFDPWVGKIPLEEGMATHSRILAWRIPMDRGRWATVHGVAKSRTGPSHSAQHSRRINFGYILACNKRNINIGIPKVHLLN